MVPPRAIEKTVSSVEDLESLAVYQSNIRAPVICPLGPLKVCVILRKCSKPGSNVEESAIRNGILVVVPIIERKDLPSQASTTCILTPPVSLGVEDSLGKSQPLRLILRRVWKPYLGRNHGREGPKHLVVIAFGLCLIRRHEVSGLTSLM